MLLVAGLLALSSVAHAQNDTRQRAQMKLAVDYERTGNFASAAEIYLRLFNNQPSNASYYSGAKRNLQRVGRHDDLLQTVRTRLGAVNDLVEEPISAMPYSRLARRAQRDARGAIC